MKTELKKILTGCAISSFALISCTRSDRVPDNNASMNETTTNAFDADTMYDPPMTGATATDAQGRALTADQLRAQQDATTAARTRPTRGVDTTGKQGRVAEPDDMNERPEVNRRDDTKAPDANAR